MAALVGKPAPRFALDAMLRGDFTTVRSDALKGRWTVLLFYPLDFTFVCPTELLAFSDRLDEFHELGADVFGVSIDSKFTHLAWSRQPRREGGVEGLRYALLADVNRDACYAYGVLTEEGVALRATFVIDPDGIVQHATVNNLSVGRSVDEALRVLAACQVARESGEVCPANWKPGRETMKPDVRDAREFFHRAAVEHAAA
jgi:peroxiredoxin (alkyl hydroperoxide reductase subunit C)